MMDVVGARFARASSRADDLRKRAFDVVVSVIAIGVLAPVMLVIALVVRTTSRGPVLYRGIRTGRAGVPFRILKFRTMRPDAEALGTTTRVGDSRITSVGHVLRRWKLDELPQLFNVLQGDMSLVGPRPEVEEHTAVYTDEEREILAVRPGITDLASIRFVRLAEELGTKDPHGEYVRRVRGEKNALRLRYVRERSFGGDLKILASTLRAILARGRSGRP